MPADWVTPSYLVATRQNQGSSVRVKVYPVQQNTNYEVRIDMKGVAGSSYWTEVAYKLGNYSAQDFDDNPSTWTIINKFDGFGTFPNGNGEVWTTYLATLNSQEKSILSIGFKAGSLNGSYPRGYWDNLAICSPLPQLTASTNNVVKRLVKNYKDPSGLTMQKAFQILHLGNNLTTWQLRNNQDATYTPLGGTPTPLIVQGFGFYESTGGLGPGQTANVRAYVNNNRDKGTYQGSFTLQKYDNGLTQDMLRIRYFLVVE